MESGVKCTADKMRINNGSAKSATKKGDLNSSSNMVRTPTRRQIDLDTSVELKNASPEQYSGLPPSARRRLMMDDLGRGVNDLRSRRACTPGERSVASSSQSHSSYHSHMSVYSQEGSIAGSHLSLNPSLMRKQRENVRRQVFTNDEPHPYGLESLPMTPAVSTRTPIQTTPVSSRVVHHTESVRESVAANGCMSSSRRLEMVEQHSSSTTVKSGLSQRKIIGNDSMSPYSSDSDCSDANATLERRKTSFYVFTWAKKTIRAAEQKAKNWITSFCSYIYMYLVWVMYAEKWFLYDKHQPQENGDVNANGTQRRSGAFRNFFTSAASSSSSQSESSSGENSTSRWKFLNIFSNNSQQSFLNFHAENNDPEYVPFVRPGVRMVYNRRLEDNKRYFIKVRKNLMILFWSFLVICLLALLWTYGNYLWEGVKSVGDGAWSLVSSVFIYWTSVGKTTPPPPSPSPAAAIVLVSSTEPEIQPIITALNPSDAEALAALKSTQIAMQKAWELEMGIIKQTLNEHGTILHEHSTRFDSIESEITKIFVAMSAASAKEKTVEQIIEQVLTVSVGETTEGKTVTLRSMFSILHDKVERERISEFVEIKLRSLSEDVDKMGHQFIGLDSNIGVIKADLSEMGASVRNLESVVSQQANAKIEIDTVKLEEIMLPLLVTEIEKKVSLSCSSKKCPDDHPYAGLSVQDIELMIRRAIGIYDADKTGLPDLALESAGGSILSTRCTKSSELRNSVISYWGFRLRSPPNTPRTIIQPGVAPGECWAFEGSVGDVVIKLAVSSIVTGFTLEHIPKKISRYPHIDSAPRYFQVLGLMHEHDTEEVHDYGSFTYEDNDEPLQYFKVSNATTKAYPIVELKVLSNHGNMKHTCIYRFRVHGAIDLSRSHLKSMEEDKENTKK